MTTLNQHDQPVQTMVANLLAFRRSGEARRGAAVDVSQPAPSGVPTLCASVLAITVNGLPGPVYWAISRVHA